MPGGPPSFHPLRVAHLERLTEDAVAVTFAVPQRLREAYRYSAGQHLTIRMKDSGGEELRRTYSICAPAPAPHEPGPGTLRVGIRLIEGGRFSAFAHKRLTEGDVLDVMTPAGSFTLPARSGAAESGPPHYAAVVGGSGITPVLSLAATALGRDPSARFGLVRCDRTAASVMFLEEVADLKDRFPDRFQLVQLLTREEQEAGVPSGRPDAKRLTALLSRLMPVHKVTGWFLCGPYELMALSEQALRTLGVRQELIHREIFHADQAPPTAPAGSPAQGGPETARTVTAKLGGRSGSWPARGGEAVLDTVLRHRPDAPYACRGGVCGTCRALLVSGTVRMDRNFALEGDEVAAGYILACQARPTSPTVELDFDR